MSVSLNPDDAKDPSRREKLLVTGATTEMFDYNGRIAEPVAVLMVDCKKSNGRPFPLSPLAFSAGNGVIPNKEGTGFDAVGLDGGLSPNCNAVLFLRSVVEKGGVPAADLATGDVTVIVGCQFEMEEVTLPPGKPRVKRDAKGQPVKDAQGQPVTEPAPVRKVWLVVGLWQRESRQAALLPGGHPDAVGAADDDGLDDIQF